jgi:hypothetical protein
MEKKTDIDTITSLWTMQMDAPTPLLYIYLHLMTGSKSARQILGCHHLIIPFENIGYMAKQNKEFFSPLANHPHRSVAVPFTP